MSIVFIIIGILIFGVLIAVHELGHFSAAKAFGVKVQEFSIGMGPRLFKLQGKETLYSFKALPLGGSCLMEGEDESSPDPRSFTAQKAWKRFVILAAGSFFNFIFGAIVVLLLVSQATGFGGTTLTDLVEGFPLKGETGLMVGDRIVSIDGEQLYYREDFSLFMSLANGKPVDMVVERNGNIVTLNDLPLAVREYTIDGKKEVRYGVTFNQITASVGEKLKYSVYTTLNYVRLVRVSLVELFSGAIGFNQMSGPVGIVSTMSQVGQQAQSFGEGLYNIVNLGALIAVNLAVMNLLPIPALDGGRIFFLLVTAVYEKISRRRIDPKYEGYVHTAGFFLLIGLMCVIMVNDVVKIFHG